MFTPVKFNINLSPVTLKRIFRYGMLAENALRKGEVLTSIEKLARLSGEEVQILLGDIVEAGIEISHGNLIQYEHLLSAVRNYLPESGSDKVVVAGDAFKIKKLLGHYEFSGYAFRIVAIVVTNGNKDILSSQNAPVTDSREGLQKVKDECVHTLILCSGYEDAQETADDYIAAGVTRIWNFSPVSIAAGPSVAIENVIPGYPKWKGRLAKHPMN